MTPRKYELKRRAVHQERTRQRIVEAALELHGTVGPARTTISAIAERAGVRRMTVYRHFPDERALFEACTTHGLRHLPSARPGALAKGRRSGGAPEGRAGGAIRLLPSHGVDVGKVPA
jgi:AcrR family transcriptional regulator